MASFLPCDFQTDTSKYIKIKKMKDNCFGIEEEGGKEQPLLQVVNIL